MATKFGKFVIDSVEYENLPRSFKCLPDFRPRTESIPLVEGRQLLIIESAQTKEVNDYTQKRRLHVQAWEAEWEVEETAVSVEMRNHLYDLYSKQTEFVIQLDDEMSQCYDRLIPTGYEYKYTDHSKIYATTNYPVYPYGYESGAVDWTDHLLVGSDVFPGDFSIDSQTGIVVIEPYRRWMFGPETRVHLKYTWRCTVRVAQFKLMPIQLDQVYYAGTVVFEQIFTP